MATERKPQLAYSELMDKMLDEDARRLKARKLISVLTHFLGRTDLTGMRALDVGCSAGFIADELAAAGARTIGADIDVPGVRKASARFGKHATFMCADGSRLPLADGSVDVCVFNHIYEHVVNPDLVMAELHRVLADDGVLYLGLGNRFGVIEPHYRLPFLSYLPRPVADRYMRATGKGDHYYERFKARPGLRRMAGAFAVWDYTLPVILDPGQFHSHDVVPRGLRLAPDAVVRAALPVVPTYVWVATKSASRPQGAPVRGGPTRL
jgi:SAM-dependent methyltransferase